MKNLFLFTVSLLFLFATTNAQNVGIGTLTPNNKLEVAGSFLVHQSLIGINALPFPSETFTIVDGATSWNSGFDSVSYCYSPGAPSGNYQPNLNGSYGIYSDYAISVQITIMMMNLSSYDSMIVIDKPYVGNETVLLAVGNGYNTLGTYTFNSNRIVVTFKSNSDANVGNGFGLFIKFLYPSNESDNSLAKVFGNYLGFDTKLGALSSGTSTASGQYSTAMGYQSTASGQYSTAMGYRSTASGQYSTALGVGASTNGFTNSFAIGGSSAVGIPQVANTAPYQLMMNFNDYVFWSGTGTGVHLPHNENYWLVACDKRKKENFLHLNGEDILHKISKIEFTSWNYKHTNAKINRHYGIMAQDFYAAFGKDHYGTIGNDTSLNPIDMIGIDMAAIQALEKRTKKIENQQKQITALQKQNENFHKQNENLQAINEMLQEELKGLMTKVNRLNNQVQILAKNGKHQQGDVGLR